MMRNILGRFTALPRWAKIPLALVVLFLALAALVLIAFFSPFLALIASLVLLLAIIILIFRAVRRQPLRRAGFLALASLAALITFGGASYALYPELFTEQAFSPREQTEEAGQQENRRLHQE